MAMEKVEQWFQILNGKLDKVTQDITAIRSELGDIRGFIEPHQTDIRLCKLAIERVDDKVEALRKSPPN